MEMGGEIKRARMGIKCDKILIAETVEMEGKTKATRKSKDFECDVCGKKYTTGDAMLKHKEVSHNQNDETFAPEDHSTQLHMTQQATLEESLCPEQKQMFTQEEGDEEEETMDETVTSQTYGGVSEEEGSDMELDPSMVSTSTPMVGSKAGGEKRKAKW